MVLGDVLNKGDELEEVEHGADSKDGVEAVPFQAISVPARPRDH